jgi:lysophospholipase L1-like esterase
MFSGKLADRARARGTLSAAACTIILLSVLAASFARGDAVPATAAPTVHMIGDSTMADKPVDPPNPEHGWGQALPAFFKASAMISNHAVNGRSTKSFIDEGRWLKVVEALRPGDWVIVQFGHNDEKSEDPKRFTDPHASFRDNLRRFVRETREKGALPILCPPVMRRRWNEAGAFYDTHGDYPDAARAVAAEEGVPLLELHKLTQQLIEGHGLEGSKRLFLWIPAGAYERKPDGWKDDTHFSAYGADRVAALAVQEMIRLELPLAEWLK